MSIDFATSPSAPAIHPIEADPDSSRADLEVVADPVEAPSHVDAPAGDVEEVAFWPIAGVATALVSVTMMVSITLAMAASPLTTWIDGFGVAAFATTWGGPGFGLMFGGAAWTLRQHKAEAMDLEADH